MANIISSKINKRYKIVTLDGQVINVGGSLTGGSQVKSVSSISIKYEIEEEEKKKDILSSKNKELLREVDNIDKEINSLNSSLYKYKEERVEYFSKKEAITSGITSSTNILEEKEKELRDLTNISNNESEEDNLINSFYIVLRKRYLI